MSNPRVPGNYGPAAIKDDSVFWYRLDLDFPDTYARFVNREWSLYGFNVDDEDVTYANGTAIGTTRDRAPDRDLVLTHLRVDGTDWTYFNGQSIGHTENGASVIRTYTIPRPLVKWDAENVLAIKGYQTSGSAGIVGDDSLALSIKSLDTPGRLKGDVDGNGAVTIADVTLALRAAVGLVTLDPAALAAIDLDGNGR